MTDDERTPSPKREVRTLYASSLKLVVTDGYIRCIKCKKAFPEAGYYKKDMVDSETGFCKDCVKKWGREHLHLTFPHIEKGQ